MGLRCDFLGVCLGRVVKRELNVELHVAVPNDRTLSCTANSITAGIGSLRTRVQTQIPYIKTTIPSPIEGWISKARMNFSNLAPSTILLTVLTICILQQRATGQWIPTQKYSVPFSERGCRDIQLNNTAQGKQHLHQGKMTSETDEWY